MNPLRILQLNTVFNGGGTDNQTLVLAAGLREHGDDVTLAIAAGSRWEPLARRLAGVRVESLPRKSALKLSRILRLARLLRTHRIQIIHAHQGRDYWPAILAARLAGCGTRAVISRHLMTRPRRLSARLLLRAGDVIAVSRAVAGVLQRELCGPREHLHQIYGGIDLAAFQPGRTSAAQRLRQQQGWADSDVVFGVVGAFNLPRGKGQLEFLEAAAPLTAAFPHARFAIVGDGSMSPALRDRIATGGLARAATILPFTDDIATVMNALDVLVHPALGTEALGLVLWEAMACGKPVIASRLDGIPEAFTENEHGLLVPPADVPALAAAMRHLAGDAELRTRFGAAGRQHVEARFSSATLAASIHQLYADILQRR
jgi:glycosyltransferase involved in cell wall biosynthesis